MNQTISPKYQMNLIQRVNDAIYAEFSSYKNVHVYIQKWHEVYGGPYDFEENFSIILKDEKIDLPATLHNMGGELLLKVAIDIGVDTPDFIPSIPIFRNEIKSEYQTASATFEKAFKQMEEHPDMAIGLANSALESILKELLKDDRIASQVKASTTLYDLAGEVLKVFSLFPGKEMPPEIKTIGSSMLSINKSIEQLRSEKTLVHGKTADDYIIEDPLYAYFIINSVATVGLFMKSYFKAKYLPEPAPEDAIGEPFDDLPF